MDSPGAGMTTIYTSGDKLEKNDIYLLLQYMDDMVITSKDTGNLWVEGEDKWEFKIKDSSALRKLEGGFGDGNNERQAG